MIYIKSVDDFRNKMDDVAAGKLVVIDFNKSWCEPCKKMKPKFEELSKQYKEAVFFYIDVDDCEDIANEYQVKCLPTFVFSRDGNILEQFHGPLEDKLRELLKQHA